MYHTWIIKEGHNVSRTGGERRRGSTLYWRKFILGSTIVPLFPVWSSGISWGGGGSCDADIRASRYSRSGDFELLEFESILETLVEGTGEDREGIEEEAEEGEGWGEGAQARPMMIVTEVVWSGEEEEMEES